MIFILVVDLVDRVFAVVEVTYRRIIILYSRVLAFHNLRVYASFRYTVIQGLNLWRLDSFKLLNR